MEINRALDQITEIHKHLTKAEVYRGYRAVPVGISGILGIIAAFIQPHIIGSQPTTKFLIYWVVVGLLCGSISGGEILINYYRNITKGHTVAQRQTRLVIGQILPSLIAGGLITFVIFNINTLQAVALCPGLWAIVYGLGTFASRPYLSRMIGWVALYYLASGVILFALAFSEGNPSLSPWGMGITFGVGQIFGGCVLYWNLERKKV